MKLTREQFDAFEAWLDAKLALATYQARDGDMYGSLSESSRESETKADLMAVLVADKEPEPVEEPREWRAQLIGETGALRFGVIDQHGTWWTDQHGQKWKGSRENAKKRARELNRVDERT
jgi:hypothetical protein